MGDEADANPLEEDTAVAAAEGRSTEVVAKRAMRSDVACTGLKSIVPYWVDFWRLEEAETGFSFTVHGCPPFFISLFPSPLPSLTTAITQFDESDTAVAHVCETCITEMCEKFRNLGSQTTMQAGYSVTVDGAGLDYPQATK
jgi:hypothetical protein